MDTLIDQKNEILFLALLINDHLVKNKVEKIPLENQKLNVISYTLEKSD